MKLIHLSKNKTYLKPFLDYCRLHGASHDESYVPDDNYEANINDPAVILKDNDNEITGAAALMLHPEYREIKKGRFRIFHSLNNKKEDYSLLLNDILGYCSGIEYIWAFLPEIKKNVGEIWLQLGFKIDRYSYLMMKDVNENIDSEFPDGIELHNVKNEKDKLDYCDIINICFRDMAGHRRLTLDTMDLWEKEPTHWSDGLLLLKHNERSIGTVRLQFDDDEQGRSLFLESLAVLPEYQGRGLATNILKTSYNITNELGLNRLFLTVNAENESAANLYLREGFEKIHTYVCYGLNINK